MVSLRVVHASHTYSPEEARRKFQIPWNKSSRQLTPIKWVLGTNPDPLREQQMQYVILISEPLLQALVLLLETELLYRPGWLWISNFFVSASHGWDHRQASPGSAQVFWWHHKAASSTWWDSLGWCADTLSDILSTQNQLTPSLNSGAVGKSVHNASVVLPILPIIKEYAVSISLLTDPQWISARLKSPTWYHFLYLLFLLDLLFQLFSQLNTSFKFYE